jgi:tRNA 2-thiouridine synthesizing protein A
VTDALDDLRARCVQQVVAVGLNCPLPLLKTKKALACCADGEWVYLSATDPNALRDLSDYAREAGHRVVLAESHDGVCHFVLEKRGACAA